MSNIDQELDEILLDKILLDTDGGQPYIKYTDEAVDALKALITTQKQELLSEIEKELPEKTDNRRLHLVVADSGLSEKQAQLFAELRQNGHNKALDQVKSIITTKRGEI